MKFENTETFNWEGAFRGLRFPMKSNGKSDSDFKYGKHTDYQYGDFIGESDMNLAQRMIKAGNPNDKFLRQIFISTDITGPRYFWSEFDTYSVGVTKDSESTMHTGAKNCYTMDDFDIKDKNSEVYQTINNHILPILNKLVAQYQQTKDFNCVRKIKQLLPESFLQKRAITMNYEVVRNMLRQRHNHRLSCWNTDFVNWCKTLPYSEELLFYCNCDFDGDE